MGFYTLNIEATDRVTTKAITVGCINDAVEEARTILKANGEVQKVTIS